MKLDIIILAGFGLARWRWRKEWSTL